MKTIQREDVTTMQTTSVILFSDATSVQLSIKICFLRASKIGSGLEIFSQNSEWLLFADSLELCKWDQVISASNLEAYSHTSFSLK